MRMLGSLMWVEGKLFGRESLLTVFAFVLPLVGLYLVGSTLGNVADPGFFDGRGPLDFFVPASVVLTVAAVGFIVLPAEVVDFRNRGVFRRFRASMAPRWAVVVSPALVATGIATGAVVLLLGGAFLVGRAAPPAHLGHSVLAYLLVVFAFSAIGMMLGMVFSTRRAVCSTGILLWFSSLLLIGAGLSSEVMPAAAPALAYASPAYWAVRLLQEPWFGHGWHWGAFGSTLIVIVVTASAAWRWSRWE